MSEIQTAILTGSFTLFGILAGALIEMLREKWKIDRKKKKKVKRLEKEDENKEQFLSPLYFFIKKNYISLSQDSDNFDILKTKVCNSIDNNINSIENLIKNHTHLLPQELNSDLMLYLDDSESLSTYFKGLCQVFNETNDRLKTELFNRNKEGYLKIVEKNNDITIILSSAVYLPYCKSDFYSPEIKNMIRKKRDELDKILDSKNPVQNQ